MWEILRWTFLLCDLHFGCCLRQTLLMLRPAQRLCLNVGFSIQVAGMRLVMLIIFVIMTISFQWMPILPKSRIYKRRTSPLFLVFHLKVFSYHNLQTYSRLLHLTRT
jgi:hypothetical protein